MPRRADVLETGDFGGDKLGGLEFAGFSRQNTDFGALQTPGAGFRRKTSEFGGPGCTFDAGHKKTHFSEFAVFSAFRTKNGVVTLTGDIGKTFSGLKNSAKRVFSCQTSKVVPEPPSSLVFRRKPAPDVRRAPNSVFCPEKPANSSPLNSSPLVTALSPLAFWVQKCVKSGPVPELLLRRVFRGPSARRGPGSESDSPPRWSVSPPSLSPLMSPLMSPLHPAPVFGAKSAQNGRVRRVRFCVGLQVGCPSLQVRRFSVESRLQTSVFRFRPGKAANSSPPSMSPLVTALSPLSVSPPSLSPLMSPLMSPLLPARFLCKKRSKRSSPKSPFFVSDCKWDARASKFAGFRSKAGSRRQFSAFGPEKRRIPARRACHRLSPLVTASSPLSLGPKSAQKAWKSETSSASMGLQILVDPASSHMLVSKPFLKRSRARFLPGPPLITLRAMEPGDSSMAHE